MYALFFQGKELDSICNRELQLSTRNTVRREKKCLKQCAHICTFTKRAEAMTIF